MRKFAIALSLISSTVLANPNCPEIEGIYRCENTDSEETYITNEKLEYGTDAKGFYLMTTDLDLEEAINNGLTDETSASNKVYIGIQDTVDEEGFSYSYLAQCHDRLKISVDGTISAPDGSYRLDGEITKNDSGYTSITRVDGFTNTVSKCSK